MRLKYLVILSLLFGDCQKLPMLMSHPPLYCDVKPVNGGPPFQIGPWPTRIHAQDWCGSALYLHPPECFKHPTDFNCRIIGNGFVYPDNYLYPVSKGKELLDCACYQSAGLHVRGGNYFISYGTLSSPDGRMIGPYGNSDVNGMGQCQKKRQDLASIGFVVGSRCFCVGSNCVGPTR